MSTVCTMIQDRFSRKVGYLRLSITSACAMRCTYCRPAVLPRLPRAQEMTVDEIVALVTHLVSHHGLQKVRLTGGEPTNRADILEIVRRLASIDGLADLAMTTNGLELSRLAKPLAEAGRLRINVSLDSVDRDCFATLTGVDGLTRVLDGLDAASAAGLQPIKLNTVVVRGQNDQELADLVAFAAESSYEIRLIELMPMGPMVSQWQQRFVSRAQMQDRLDSIVERWQPLPPRPGAAARCYRARLFDGREVTVGFIAAMSCPFCETCDRIRITADGTVFPCLMDQPAGNVMSALRPAPDCDALNNSN